MKKNPIEAEQIKKELNERKSALKIEFFIIEKFIEFTRTNKVSKL